MAEMDRGEEAQAGKNIDSVLSRIGFGRYQIYVFCIVGIGQVADGMEMTAIALLTPVLEETWDLSLFQMGLLGGVIFVGMTLGNAITACLGDTCGRLTLMRHSTLLLFLSSLISGLMPEYYSFLCTRFFVGTAAGMLIPISVTYCTEVCPKEQRGGFLVALNVCFVAGMVLIIGLAWAFIGTSGNSAWRYVLILASIPVLFAHICLLFYIQESPRFLANQWQYGAAVLSLNTIADSNGRAKLDRAERCAIEAFSPVGVTPGLRKVKRMLEGRAGEVTGPLAVLWFAVVFTYYGLLFLIPNTFSSSAPQSSYFLLLLSALVQLPSVAISLLTIDHPNIGRKHTITLSLFAQTASFGAAALVNNTDFQWISLVAAMFFISIWFNTLYPYTGELYHTSMRALALGSLGIVGRLAGAVAPLLLLELKSVGTQLPFLFLGLVSLIAAINALCIPFETRNTALDLQTTDSSP